MDGNLILSDDDYRVAAVGLLIGDDHFSRSTQLANARFIAAAPETAAQRDELLEALVDLLNWVDPNENFVGLHMEVDMARAAIAKTRRETT